MTTANSGSDNDNEPTNLGDFEIGGAPAKAAKSSGKSSQSTGEQLATKSTQPRTDAGKFDEKMRPLDDPRVKDVAREAVRAAMKGTKLARETDADALDSVATKGKDAKAKSDPASSKARATAEAKSEQTSTSATRVAQHVADARKALELEGWTEEDLAGLKPERILALGKRAVERTTATARELREQAAADKSATTDPAPSSARATAAAPDKSKSDDKAAADPDVEALAEEHFKEFTDDKGFKKSLAAFAKAIDATTRKALETKLSEEISSTRSEIRGEAALERAYDRLRGEFPQVDTTDGREALEALAPGLIKSGKFTDATSVIRAACKALGWADAAQAQEREEAEDIRDARGSGQVVTSGVQPAPRALGDREIALREVRRAMADAR